MQSPLSDHQQGVVVTLLLASMFYSLWFVPRDRDPASRGPIIFAVIFASVLVAASIWTGQLLGFVAFWFFFHYITAQRKLDHAEKQLRDLQTDRQK